jgi:hypothetical protein
MAVKVNLIIDGNYLLYKDVFILKKTKTINQDLSTLLLKELNFIINSFNYDKIFFVSDIGQSWRKKLNKEYKVREKDDSIDWDVVFREFNNIKNEISNRPNMNLLEIQNLEGDDIISFLVKKTNLEGNSNVIIAYDGDLHQLLKLDLHSKFINVMWNHSMSDERIFIPENYKVFLEHIKENSENDLFNMTNDDDFASFLSGIIKKSKVIDIIDERSLFIKLISGDVSDTIQSIAKVKDGKYSAETRGIGKDGALKCYNMYKELYPENIDFKSQIFIDNTADIVSYYKNIKDENSIEFMKERLKDNMKLIILDEEYLPEDLHKKLLEKCSIVLKKNFSKIEIPKVLEEDDFWNS